MDIISLIRQYNLIYLTPEKLSETLSVLTHEAVVDVKNDVNNLIHEGVLFLDENNKVSISADKGYYKAKISLNKKGYGFASVEGFKDFFIPAFAINSAFDGDDCLVQIINIRHCSKDNNNARKILLTLGEFIFVTFFSF